MQQQLPRKLRVFILQNDGNSRAGAPWIQGDLQWFDASHLPGGAGNKLCVSQTISPPHCRGSTEGRPPHLGKPKFNLEKR